MAEGYIKSSLSSTIWKYMAWNGSACHKESVSPLRLFVSLYNLGGGYQHFLGIMWALRLSQQGLQALVSSDITCSVVASLQRYWNVDVQDSAYCCFQKQLDPEDGRSMFHRIIIVHLHYYRCHSMEAPRICAPRPVIPNRGSAVPWGTARCRNNKCFIVEIFWGE